MIIFLPLLILIGAGIDQNNPLMLVAGIVISILVLAAFAWAFVIRKQLLVTAAEAISSIELFGISLWRKAIALLEIAQIYTIDQGMSSAVVIAGGDTRLQVGELNKDLAQWLIGFAYAGVSQINSTRPIAVQTLCADERYETLINPPYPLRKASVDNHETVARLGQNDRSGDLE